MLHKTEASAHVGIFHLPDHNIEVPLLVFRSTSDMCTIQENGQWRRSGARVFVLMSIGGNVKRLGNASQAISDRRVRLGRTRQEHFEQPGCLSKRMTRSQFSLKVLKFRCRAIRKHHVERRKQNNFCGARA